MRTSLFQKFFVWGSLNLFLLFLVPALVVIWMMLGPSDKLYPPSWFSDRIHACFREIASEMQDRSRRDWGDILDHYSSDELSFYLVDPEHKLFIRRSDVPQAVLDAAQHIPSIPYDTCMELPGNQSILPSALSDIRAGLAPDLKVVFLYDRHSRRFWYVRPLFVMGEDELPHNMLLIASSPSITGHGYFFDLTPVLVTLLVILLLSFLWWIPFIMHITRPLHAMTEIAERIAKGDYSSTDIGPCQAVRKDEIGRLAASTSTMAKQVSRTFYAHQTFLRHIAHELGSPITRIKLGLAIVSSRTQPEIRERIDQVLADVDDVESLIDDVISYLHAETSPAETSRQHLQLRPLLQRLVEKHGTGADIRIDMDGDMSLFADIECLCRTISNLVRNAVCYAAHDGPITIRCRLVNGAAHISVQDHGPGVQPAELEHITDPFYRGSSSSGTSGTGLGLTIAKNSIRLMGGSMTCRNLPEGGFSVEIILPDAG